MRFETVFVILFAVAAGVALVARRLKLPYTVALVLAGLGLGSLHVIDPPQLTKEILYAVFLPGLVFEAAFHLDYQKFWQSKIAILTLSIPGVVIAILLTAALLLPAVQTLHLVDGFKLRHCLVFASLIAATDPIAVVALFKSLGAPRRLACLIEGESLLNDGTAVVLFTLLLGAVNGGATSLSGAALEFVRIVGLAVLVGLGLGWLASRLTHHIDDPMIEITLTTVVAYGAFALAEHLHLSGIIATVVAGMLCGNYGARTGMSPSTRVAVESFWEYVAFALNSAVFLLIGLDVSVDALLRSWLPILVSYIVTIAGRAGLIFLTSVLLKPTREAMPWSYSAVLTWGGLRGGLSMVLALALPRDFPFREMLVTMTFGVVILSILIQGLSMGAVLRRLKLVSRFTKQTEYELERGRVRAKSAALRALEQLTREGAIDAEMTRRLREEYQGAVADAERRVQDLHLEADALRVEEERAARRHLLLAEKATLLAAHHGGSVGDEAIEQLLQEVDAQLVDL